MGIRKIWNVGYMTTVRRSDRSLLAAKLLIKRWGHIIKPRPETTMDELKAAHVHGPPAALSPGTTSICALSLFAICSNMGPTPP